MTGIVVVIGGVVKMESGKHVQLRPYTVGEDGELRRDTAPDAFSYESANPAVASVSASGLITGGELHDGVAQTQITVTLGGEQEIIDVFLYPEGGLPDPQPEPAQREWATPEQVLIGKSFTTPDGDGIGTAAAYFDGDTLYVPYGIIQGA